MTTLVKNADAAALIGCTPKTLNFWRCKGKGPKFIKTTTSRQGGVLYDLVEIEKWKADRTFQGTAAYLVKAKAAAAAASNPPSAPITPPWLKPTA